MDQLLRMYRLLPVGPHRAEQADSGSLLVQLSAAVLPNCRARGQEPCEPAHVPVGVQAQTKHDLALAVIDQAQAWHVPFRIVLADAGYGRVASFIKGLEERHLH